MIAPTAVRAPETATTLAGVLLLSPFCSSVEDTQLNLTAGLASDDPGGVLPPKRPFRQW